MGQTPISKCSVKGCLNNIYVSDGYCNKHTCKKKDCSVLALCYSYCQIHGCAFKKCNNKKTTDYKQCSKHRCKFKGKEYQDGYGYNGTYNTIYCANDINCIKHMCKNCNSLRDNVYIVNKIYCSGCEPIYICNIDNCNSLRDNVYVNKIYCSKCEPIFICNINNCNNRIVKNKLCENHKCKIEKCEYTKYSLNLKDGLCDFHSELNRK